MKIETLKFWCQKVLPLVYDESLSYYELLNKVVNRLNEMQTAINETVTELVDVENSINTLNNKIDGVQTYVDNYFDNLDITQEVSNIILEMFENGELTSIIAGAVGNYSTPIFVATMNDMTDTNRIYVLESNKHIYQAINGLFFDTGVVYGNGDTINVAYSGSGVGNNLNLRTVTVE